MVYRNKNDEQVGLKFTLDCLRKLRPLFVIWACLWAVIYPLLIATILLLAIFGMFVLIGNL